MSIIHNILYKNDIIDKIDYDILYFAWKIRNCIHQNFTTDQDIEFTYPDISTGERYQFKYKKGDELYHPNDLLGFFVISEQLTYINDKNNAKN